MKAVIGKRNGGEAVRIPSSKSLSHRALIAAALAHGTSRIRNLVYNNDTEATIRALQCLGAEFHKLPDGTLEVSGAPRPFHCDQEPVDCGESGSTLRFLIPIFSLCDNAVTFTGQGRLMDRPQTVYEELFQKQGLLFEPDDQYLRLKGPLCAGSYTVRGDISSQFITGLLFLFGVLEARCEINILEPYESRSYVGLTEDVLGKAGIVLSDEDHRILISEQSSYRPFELDIDGDDSQGAFFAELALVSNRPVTVLGMRHESRQGDHAIVSLFEQAGGRSMAIDGGYRFEPGTRNGIRADLSDCPDLGPALFAMAAAMDADSVFTGCGRLRIKESDRIAAMQEELEKLGVSVCVEGDTVRIHGTESKQGGVALNGHNDHRIVMALAALGPSCSEPITILGVEAVRKSYPDFFQDLETAGVEVMTK